MIRSLESAGEPRRSAMVLVFARVKGESRIRTAAALRRICIFGSPAFTCHFNCKTSQPQRALRFTKEIHSSHRFVERYGLFSLFRSCRCATLIPGSLLGEIFLREG